MPPRKTNVETAALVKARGILGSRLRERRISLGLSQEDVASTGVIDRSRISRVETGKTGYGVDFLLILDELYTKMELKQEKDKTDQNSKNGKDT